MTQTPPNTVQVLRINDALARLPDATLEALAAKTELQRCATGQPLVFSSTLPERVFLVVEGDARLIGDHHGKPYTIERLGPGSFIGLASLLRAEACETVSAASPMVLASLKDAVVLELYQNDPSFRDWCDSHLWAAELGAVVGTLTTGSARARQPEELRRLVHHLLEEATLVGASKQLWSNLGDDQCVLVGSSNLPDLPIGTILERGLELPNPRPPLPARLISLLRSDVEAILESAPDQAVADDNGKKPSSLNRLDAPAEGSGLDLGQQDPSRGMVLIRGEGVLEETLAAFQMLAKILELPYRRDSIEKILRDNLRRGMKPDLQLCGQIAAMMGLLVSGAKVPAQAGTRLMTPCLLPWESSFAIAVSSNAKGLRLASPSSGWVQLSPADIADKYPEGIELLMLERSSASPEQNFGPGWFWPALKRYRGMLFQVLLASFVVQLFSLANPLLIQVIIDKVITQRSMDTLQILGIALVVVTLMEGIISSLRTYLFADTTNRIDLRLGAEVIDRLLRLPLGYFDRRPVGELGTRIAELEKIRNFITGQALMTILDSAFSVIYIIVMAIYSWLLTIIALIVLPIQIALTLIGSPIIRRQIRSVATENANTQSHLVEVLTGIQTVKAQNVEMVSRWKWQDFYSKYISRSFEKTLTGTVLTETSQVLQKLSQLLVLWVGASLVLKGELTLGQLIAFRIISGYVTQPLLRLSSIWQNVQELRVSFERLADIVDTPVESDDSDRSKIPLPPINGDVLFEDLNFSFTPGTPDVLKNINLHIEQGTFVGIVGQSGSGKSTLMKLLPRLYAPTQGRILLDKYDIAKVELYSLRRQIGIVPQDPLLFSGTISDNIALTNPEASSDSIVKAAMIAEAHDFIMELSEGYSSRVGERGASLSGGQRQRIAIARTLLSNPKLLVMDEATSALDYDTERRVCDNLVESLHDRTVFFITHRLSTIRRADLIIMMHQGVIVETGTHDELMALKGRYFALYRQQEAS
ncbi:MAG: peptidase domain-containing ABC transporter [Cyanobacteria bacterium]|nr:peptidase domain-containing ABC transporter [Cyanobacteriota bacterium]